MLCQPRHHLGVLTPSEVNGKFASLGFQLCPGNAQTYAGVFQGFKPLAIGTRYALTANESKTFPLRQVLIRQLRSDIVFSNTEPPGHSGSAPATVARRALARWGLGWSARITGVGAVTGAAPGQMGLCRRTAEDRQSPEAIRAASERLEGLTAYLLAQHAAARDRLYRPVATKAGPPHSMRQQRRTSSLPLDRIPAAISRHQQRQAVLSDEEELGAVTSLLEMKAGRLVGYQAGRSRPSSPKRLRRRAASDALELRRTSSSLSGGSAFHLVSSSTGV